MIGHVTKTEQLVFSPGFTGSPGGNSVMTTTTTNTIVHHTPLQQLRQSRHILETEKNFYSRILHALSGPVLTMTNSVSTTSALPYPTLQGSASDAFHQIIANSQSTQVHQVNLADITGPKKTYFASNSFPEPIQHPVEPQYPMKPMPQVRFEPQEFQVQLSSEGPPQSRRPQEFASGLDPYRNPAAFQQAQMVFHSMEYHAPFLASSPTAYSARQLVPDNQAQPQGKLPKNKRYRDNPMESMSMAKLQKVKEVSEKTTVKRHDKWEKEQDEQLRHAVKIHGVKSWVKVAKMVGGRTNVQCRQRWVKVLAKEGCKRGYWTPREDARLLAALSEQKQSGATEINWVLVSEKVTMRTMKQCRERYTCCLDPTLNKTPFTEEEDMRLIAQVEEHGSKWSLIKKQFKNRSDGSLKSRYLALLRKSDKFLDIKG